MAGSLQDMSMIERVARAILKARFYDCEPDMYRSLDDFWESVLHENIDDARLDARAAIAAMREPTPEMVDALVHAEGECWADPNIPYSTIFTAAIDAALSE